MAVYILHFSEPYKHSRHYTGFAEDGNVEARLETHRRGQGARLTQVVVQSGRELILGRVFEGKDRNDERRLKNGKNVRRHCNICNGIGEVH
jgi:predicted GIY-YIG superfamily endonuclease